MDFINHNKKFAFIHIPKTGGTSIQEAFIDWNLDGENFEMINAPVISNWKGWENYKDYRVFAFVRDPYDRLYSSYAYHIRQQHINASLTFEEFVDFVIDKECGYDSNIMWHCYRTQRLMTHRGDDCMVTDVIRFENFDQGYQSICDYLELPPVSLRHENKTAARKSYREEYTSETALKTEKHFLEDFVTFGYDCSLSETINECNRI